MATRPDLKRAVPKTKNTAKDYNDNFDKMMQFVDDTLDECKDYVDAYMPPQTGQAGKYLATNGTIASWVSVGENFPSASYIDGLIITKSNSNTIGVSAGSCYDSTKTFILRLDSAATKQNTNQASNATYYVYIIGNATTVDILISASSPTPILPSGYIYQRQIGYYKTDSSGTIESVAFYGIDSSSPRTSQGSFFPDYTAGVSMTANVDNTATENGWIEAYATVPAGGSATRVLTINGSTRTISRGVGGTDGSHTNVAFYPVKKGDVYKLSAGTLTFYPIRSN